MVPRCGWISAVGDLDPTVLTIRLNDNPVIAGEILHKIHNLVDDHERCKSIQLLTLSLRQQTPETWDRICEEPEGLQHVLVGIVSTNFLCGMSKDDFLGPSEHWSKNYAYTLLTILEDSARGLARALKDRPSPTLQQSAKHTLKELSPVWDRLTELVPSSSWESLGTVRDISEHPVMIPLTCAATVGFGIMMMYSTLYRLTPTPVLNPHLISYIIHAFCIGLPNLSLAEFDLWLTNVLSMFSAQQRRAILVKAFGTETISHMFVKTYCNYLMGRMRFAFDQSNGGGGGGGGDRTLEVYLRYSQFLNLVVRDGPETLLRAVSSPGTLEELISSTLYACQRARCHDKPRTKDEDFDRAFMFTLRTITLPVFKHRQHMRHRFTLDARTCHILLCYCTLGLLTELKSPGDDAEALLDCIAIYALPGASSNISTLSKNRQHDIHNLRRIIRLYLAEAHDRLKGAPQNALQRKAERIIHQIAHELDLNRRFANQYLGRLHRCSFLACECSGMKAPHRMRICKGCLSAFYCNKRCQERDWLEGRHKDICEGKTKRG